MEQKIISEVQRNNKTAMIAHAIQAIVMNVFCLLQFVIAKRSGMLLAIDVLLGMGPVIAEFLFWKKNKETSMIKHLVGYGFAVFYTFTIFTWENNLVFAFVVPMILIVWIKLAELHVVSQRLCSCFLLLLQLKNILKS